MKNLIIINSHPIQYYTPLYEEINLINNINLQVWFCSKNGLQEYYDREFNKEIKWYNPKPYRFTHLFLYNYSLIKNFSYPIFGLVNLGIIYKLYKAKKSIIWIDSWSQATFILSIIFGKLFGHTICLRSETPISHEISKSKFKLLYKKIFLRFLFNKIKYFLYIGTANKKFYQYYNVKEEQLFFCPYCVDNNFFLEQKLKLENDILDIKKDLSINANKIILIFCGKLINKKNPLDLFDAFIKLDSNKFHLIYIGSGPLENQLKQRINDHRINNITITGFVNLNDISKFYIIADVFIMCSGLGETWGLSTNEAIIFNKKLVISDLTGCSEDLVKVKYNGFIFKTGDTKSLYNSILQSLELDSKLVKITNEDLIKKFSYDTCIKNINNILQNFK